MENLNITEMENHPIKWVCNFKGQRAIGICGKTQKIAMFASDERVSRLLNDIVIGTDSEQEGYGCEEKDRCCNFECDYCEISPRQYLNRKDTAVKKRTDAAISNVSSVKSHQDSTCRSPAKSLQTKI